LKYKINTFFVYVLIFSLLNLTGCKDKEEEVKETEEPTDRTKVTERINGNTYETWDEVVESGKDKTVNFYMWSGNDKVNEYIDETIAKRVKKLYGITLKRKSMDASKYIAKLLGEKEDEKEDGDIDLLWINAESFKNAKQTGLLWGPFTDILENQNKYYNLDSVDLNYDNGLLIEGYEALWGKTQLIFNYDTENIENPPKNYTELLAWTKKNEGEFTYPSFKESYIGKTFIRNSYYELTENLDVYKSDISKESFLKSLEPVETYFNELNKYTWKSGEKFPEELKDLEEMFRDGDVIMSMSFDMFKAKVYHDEEIYTETVENYVFDSGNITNPHYLAIPFNSQNKAASMLVINYLQSPEAQIEKVKGSVWGDLPGLDVTKLNEEDRAELKEIEEIMKINLENYNKYSLPELKLEQIEWFNEYFSK
jgi:putative spermidine/putrescine transport system substrate-binding protein